MSYNYSTVNPGRSEARADNFLRLFADNTTAQTY